ncbi:MAG: hypothetical protein AAF658_02960 [Myxococcota bacterium]
MIPIVLSLIASQPTCDDDIQCYLENPSNVPETVATFANTHAQGATPLERTENLYRALLSLKTRGRIVADPDNVPKRRLPVTGLEVLARALDDDAEPLPAGCYELSTALLIAARHAKLRVVGMDRVDATEQIGHVVVGLEVDEARPMVFDLQNEEVTRSEAYLPVSDRTFAAHHFNHLAVARHLRGEYASARMAIDEALARAPNEPTFLNNRAAVLLAEGAPWSARAEIAHAIEARPDQAMFRYQWGVIEQDLGRLSQARGAFESVLSLSPGHGGARRELAWTLIRLGHVELGERRLRSALDVSDVRAYLATALLARGAAGAASEIIAAMPESDDKRALETWSRAGTPLPGSRVEDLMLELEGTRQ